jgi:crotonobetainyl-CoA:carnitine CoA-transferase CaiB-like acyl-CoA transferase
MTPLSGITVLDFSTLLPGPLATLMLAEAGAEVIKVERKEGDEVRHRKPRFGGSSASFAMLNHGKRSVSIDLKEPAAVARLTPLIARADVLVEQFRPGVMRRLGLHYDAVRTINPRIIYCSLSGYGQNGTRAQSAGHDINYLAESGLLSLVTGADAIPALPSAPYADIAGGTYPLVINVLLALLRRAQTNEGCHLDIAMADNLYPFAYWALARGFVGGDWPEPNADPITGALARYRTYRTRDGRGLAVGALEDKFWLAFCALIELPEALRNDRETPAQSSAAVAQIIIGRDAKEWEQLFAGHDICCSVVKTVQEAASGPAAAERGLFDRQISAGAATMPALPLAVDKAFRRGDGPGTAPELGEANALLGPAG